MNEVYMFLIVFSGVFIGMISANLFQAYLSAKRIEKHLAEMQKYSKDLQKTRIMDIEKLDRIINKKRGRKRKVEQSVKDFEQFVKPDTQKTKRSKKI